MFADWKNDVAHVKKSFGALGKKYPKMLQAYGALGAAAAEGNVLDAKTRELIALAVAVTTRLIVHQSPILCLALVSQLLVKKVKPRAVQAYFVTKDVNSLAMNQLIMTVFGNKMSHKTSSDRAYRLLFDEH